MFLGAIPLNEKIYLSNKTLINIEDLKVGDKLFSLEVIDKDIKDSIDFYDKYIVPGKEIENFKLTEAEVYSVYFEKQNRGKFIKVIDQFIHHGQYIAASWPNGDNNKFGFYKSWSFAHQNTDGLKILKLKSNFSTEDLEKLKIFDYQDFNNLEEELLEDNSASINIVGGHCYFTENFVLFAGGDSSW